MAQEATHPTAQPNSPGFTPGPWLIGSNGDLDIGIVARDPGHGWQMVATVVIDEDVAQDEDEHLANARLIAAAPDLYAACEEALSLLNTDRGAVRIEDAPALGSLFLKLKSALAKAGGK